MTESLYIGKMQKNGRVQVPKPIRKALNLEEGTPVQVKIERSNEEND